MHAVWVRMRAPQDRKEAALKRSRLKTLPDFDACSVALFIFMTMGAAVHARAQQAPTPTPTPRANVQSTATREQTVQAIPANNWTAGQIKEAFKRTDANNDGAISREEARIFNGLTRNFDSFDANKDGSISSAEFDEALK